MLRIILSLVVLLQPILAMDSSKEEVFLTSIDQIRENLSAAVTKRLIIGGLHSKSKDTKGFWVISQPTDIVINNDKAVKPDIYVKDGFSSDLGTQLAPLTHLTHSMPIKFDEIIFEHVGNQHDLKNLLDNQLGSLPFLTSLLTPGGKFIHQSFYQYMMPFDNGGFSKVTKEHTIPIVYGFKPTVYDSLTKRGDVIISYDKYVALLASLDKQPMITEEDYNRLRDEKIRLAAIKLKPVYFNPDYENPTIPEEVVNDYHEKSKVIWTKKTGFNPLQAYKAQIDLDKTLIPHLKDIDLKNWQLYIDRREVEYELLSIFPGNRLVLEETFIPFKGLNILLAEVLTPQTPTYTIRPEDYATFFEPNSILIQYIKALETILGYQDVTLSFEVPPHHLMQPKIFAFKVTATKPMK